MNAPINNNNRSTQRFLQPIQKPMHLLSLIGTLLLISMAAAKEETWNIVTQKVGVWGILTSLVSSNKDIEDMTIIHNSDGWRQTNGYLGDDTLTMSLGCDNVKLLHDIPNNRIRLEMTPKSWGYTSVTPRWIYYLDNDGPSFMQHLLENEDWFSEHFTSDDFIRGQWKKDDADDWKPAQGKDDNVIGYTVKLSKADTWNETFSKLGADQKKMYELRVHMNLDDSIKYFETSQCNFEITNLSQFNATEGSIHIGVKAAYKDAQTNSSYWQCAPASRWLCFDDNLESKRFLFFLVENYLFSDKNQKYGPVFDKEEPNNQSTGASVKAWLKGEAEVVKEWIKQSEAPYGLIDPANTTEFVNLCGITGLTKGCPQCEEWGFLSSRFCECKGRHEPYQFDSDDDSSDQGCPAELRCEKCTCSVCNGKGFVDAAFNYNDWKEPQDEPAAPVTCPEGELAQWTAAEVGQFIKSLGKAYEKYASAFSDPGIDGEYLANNDLEETFDNVSPPIENKIHRNMIRREIQDRLPKTNVSASDDHNNDPYEPDTLPAEPFPIRNMSNRISSNRNRSSQAAAANRRRIAEDNIQPFVVLCAWILALIVGMAVFLIDRHATISKRDAMQRGQRNWEIPNVTCNLF